MIRPGLCGGVYLAVVSHARSANVAKMQALVGEATWFVGAGEGDAYRRAGAAAVVESGALCRSRNAALEEASRAGALACVELSDDLVRVQFAVRRGGKVVAEDASFESALGRVLEGMERTGARLGGAAPTSNPFYANVDRPVHTSAFIVGDFIAVAGGCPLRFDEAMSLKEDYDYTLWHMAAYGVVARRDDVLMSFLHRTNEGGAVEARTPLLERENIAALKARWPQFVVDNPRRSDEVLLRFPRVSGGRSKKK